MEDDTTRTETFEIVGEEVVVERTVAYREYGVIVTLDAESRGSEPTAFTLLDEFPGGLPVSDTGFQPGHEPPGGGVDADGATVEGAVAPDEGLTVVYAVKFFEPAPEVDFGEPELLEGGPVGEETQARPGVLARGGTASPASSFARSGTGPAAPGSEAGSASSPAETESTATVGESESADPTAEDGGKPIGATLGLFDGDGGTTRGDEVTDGDHGASRPTAGSDFDPGGASDAGRTTVDTRSATPDADRDADGSDGRPETSDGRDGTGEPDAPDDAPGPLDADVGVREADAGSDGGVVSALVADLREGSASDEELAALRRALGVRTGASASDDVRIEHLQARMGEFAAYAEELRAVIDEHGTAEAFVDRFEDCIDGLRADLDAVEAELETLRGEVEDRHGRNAEAIERLERRVGAVESSSEEFAAVFEDPDGSE